MSGSVRSQWLMRNIEFIYPSHPHIYSFNKHLHSRSFLQCNIYHSFLLCVKCSREVISNRLEPNSTKSPFLALFSQSLLTGRHCLALCFPISTTALECMGENGSQALPSISIVLQRAVFPSIILYHQHMISPTFALH